MPPCSSLFLNARSCSSNTQTPLPTCSPTHDLSPCPRAPPPSPPANPLTYTMVKEKNHTNRNQSYKAHRRGIKKVKPQRYRSLRGVSVLESEREVERERAWLRTRATRAAGYGRRFFLWIGNRVRYRRGAAAPTALGGKAAAAAWHGGHRPASTSARPRQARRQSVASTEAERGCSAGAFPTLGDAAGSPAYGASGHAREQAAACRGALAFAFGLLGLLWSCYLAASDDKGAKPPGVSSRPRLPP